MRRRRSTCGVGQSSGPTGRQPTGRDVEEVKAEYFRDAPPQTEVVVEPAEVVVHAVDEDNEDLEPAERDGEFIDSIAAAANRFLRQLSVNLDAAEVAVLCDTVRHNRRGVRC